ncbi:MAG TPA: hypothetical protein VF746_14885 [Longimicrobium sp.]|jgi:hypothetical protein
MAETATAGPRRRKLAGILAGAMAIAIAAYVVYPRLVKRDSALVARISGMRTIEANGALLGSFGRRIDIPRNTPLRDLKKHEQHIYRRMSSPWPWQSVKPYKVQEYTISRTDSVRLERLGVRFDSASGAQAAGGDQSAAGYRIVILEIDNPDGLVDEINDSLARASRLVRRLSRGDPEYRIVTAVGVLFDHRAEVVSRRELDARLLELAIKGSSADRSTVGIADGAIVGYRYARICWNADGEVQELVTDEQGTDTCPPGSLPTRASPGAASSGRPSAAGTGKGP